MNDIPKILAPIPAMIRHQTDALCCVVLMRAPDGECHIVADGRRWKSMIVAAAGRVLDTATQLNTEESSMNKEEAQND